MWVGDNSGMFYHKNHSNFRTARVNYILSVKTSLGLKLQFDTTLVEFESYKYEIEIKLTILEH